MHSQHLIKTAPSKGGSGGGLGDGPWRGSPLARAAGAGCWAAAGPEGSRLPCRRGRPRQPPPRSARGVAGPPARRDGAFPADARLPCAEGQAPGLGLFAGAPRLHPGRLQGASPVAWSTALCVGLRAPLERCIEFVRCSYSYLVCKRLTPLVIVAYARCDQFFIRGSPTHGTSDTR